MLSRLTHNHPEAQILGARALYLNGALDAASRKASDVLRGNGDNIHAALLVVSVHVRQGRPAEAMAALEAAVSANFSIREAPLYQVVHAQVLVANGRLEDAKRVSGSWVLYSCGVTQLTQQACATLANISECRSDMSRECEQVAVAGGCCWGQAIHCCQLPCASSKDMLPHCPGLLQAGPGGCTGLARGPQCPQP